jgi:hypothetical protein
MNRKIFYLVLGVLGFALPYSQFVPSVIEHGLNMRLFVQQLFANRIGGFFGLDVLVSAVTLIGFMRSEGARLKMRALWLPIVSVLLVGVSLGLYFSIFESASLRDRLRRRFNNKKGRHPTGSAPTDRILWNTLYFPFFGPLASSFFPFFFIAMLLSSTAPMRRSQSHSSGHDGLCPPCHLAMYASAARGCQENSVLQPIISCYCAIPPV